jgi:proteasome lid subunit RPN8/RPN11
MIEYLAARPPEMAGLLLGPEAEDGLITHFVPDRGGKGTTVSFQLDTASMNRELKRAKEYRLDCKGIAHSHPGLIQPSHGDLAYLTKLFALPVNSGAMQFFMPITVGRRLYSYVYAHGRVWPTEIFIV